MQWIDWLGWLPILVNFAAGLSALHKRSVTNDLAEKVLVGIHQLYKRRDHQIAHVGVVHVIRHVLTVKDWGFGVWVVKGLGS